jgi:hypothetical protein
MSVPMPAMKVADWPELDRRLWTAAQGDGGLFGEPGLAAGLAVATRQMIEYSHGVWLGWLGRSGALDAETAPMDRVTEARVLAFREDFRPGRAPGTEAAIISGLASFIRCTAPPDGHVWLTRAAQKLKAHAKPIRAKPPRMATIRELLTAGIEMFEQGRARMAGGAESHGAVEVRDGLMILMLAARPIRRRNLCGMKLDETVFIRKQDVFARFAPEMTKTGRQIAFHYPRWQRPFIDYYLDVARPMLMIGLRETAASEEGWFWPSFRGSPMRPNSLTARIPDLIQTRLGRRVTLHLFRDCAATDIAIHDPAHVRMVKEILQHSSTRAGEAFYIQADSVSALSNYADLIASLREDAP